MAGRRIDEVIKMSEFCSHPDFLEVGQKKFFESILQLLPSRLKEGKKTLLADLNNGEESVCNSLFLLFENNFLEQSSEILRVFKTDSSKCDHLHIFE